MRSAGPNGFLILKVDERFEAGQASYEEVKNEIAGASGPAQDGGARCARS